MTILVGYLAVVTVVFVVRVVFRLSLFLLLLPRTLHHRRYVRRQQALWRHPQEVCRWNAGS